MNADGILPRSHHWHKLFVCKYSRECKDSARTTELGRIIGRHKHLLILIDLYNVINILKKVTNSKVTADEHVPIASESDEKSENIIGLDPYILNSFSYLDPI